VTTGFRRKQFLRSDNCSETAGYWEESVSICSGENRAGRVESFDAFRVAGQFSDQCGILQYSAAGVSKEIEPVKVKLESQRIDGGDDRRNWLQVPVLTRTLVLAPNLVLDGGYMTNTELIQKRVIESLAMITIGDGVLGLIQPRRHILLWRSGPRVWRRTMTRLARRTGLTQLFALAAIGLGIWLASRQRASVGRAQLHSTSN